MSLERTQALHNSFISNAGNVSGSNDPAQKPNDANELLIKGASAAAAGRELGLSEEETLAAVSRQFRRQRRADDRVTQDDVLRQLAQSAATVREDVGSPEIKGVTYQNDDEIDAVFGKTDYEMGLRDLDADNGVNSSAPEPEIRGTRRYGIASHPRLFKIRYDLKRILSIKETLPLIQYYEMRYLVFRLGHLSTDMTHSQGPLTLQGD